MLWFHITTHTISMGTNSVDHFSRSIDLSQQFRRFHAVLIGILLKVYIVEQSAQRPKICLISITLILGKEAHDPLHRQTVKNMKRLLVILFQQCHCLFPINCSLHDNHPFLSVHYLIVFYTSLIPLSTAQAFSN